MDVEAVLQLLEERGVEWVDLQFTDLAGILHHVTVHRSLVDEEVFRRGIGKLDGSSVRGFKTISESDLVLRPVPSTFAVVPWSQGVARFICQVFDTGGEKRFVRDPRYAAERLEENLGEQGLRAYVAVEPEFFIFDRVEVRVGIGEQVFRVYSREAPWSSEDGVFMRVKEGYYPVPPQDKLFDVRLEMLEVLRKYFNVEVEVTHHEVATAGQAEINFRYSTPVATADNLQTMKYVVKNVAARHGLVATFMPKPLVGDNGSGMHTHVSIWRGDENLFYDPNDGYAELSQYARYFIGGLIEHGRALAAFTNPTVNSYRRLVPGFEAPVYLVWSRANRSAAIRVPFYHRGDWKARRIEYRSPDPSANPYLALAAIVLAGLDGVRRKIDPGDPVDENVYTMTPEKRRSLGIRELPRSLDEALDELEADNEWLKPVFPKELVEAYIEMKRAEARQLQQYTSPAEAYYYLDA